MNKIEEEFNLYDKTSAWTSVYEKIRKECPDYSIYDAKRAEFASRNRYRDVSPYDHSRVRLERNEVDYINASLVEYPLAHRSYILTQGPLSSTSGHFWLMVWEQNSGAVLMLNRIVENARGPLPNTSGHFWLLVWEANSAVILMLNRIIEKGQVKCHPYFPMNTEDDNEDELIFEDVGLKVSLVSKENANFYVIRTLEIEDIQSGEKKRVLQFHYITWPDFGVPESPEAFLDFLFAVRKSGVLESTVGPAVIHCSAGIGRSGTFILVDTCLILIENSQDPNSVVVRDVLMEMRQFRMGLIQTADQLRFSYNAIIEGCKKILPPHVEPSIDNNHLCQLSNSCNSNSLGEVVNDLDPPSPPTLSPTDNNNPPTDKMAANEITNRKITHQSGHMAMPKDNTNIYASHESDKDPVSNQVGNGRAEQVAGETEEVSNEQLIVEEFLNMDRIRQKGQESTEIRRRNREERKRRTGEQISRMKKKQQESELWRERKRYMSPYLWGISLAVLVGSYIMYRYYATQ